MHAGAPSEERTRVDETGSWIQKLADLEDKEARSGFVAGNPGAHHLQTIESLHNEILRLAYVDFERAARLAQASEWIADKLDNPRGRALSLRSQGHVFYAQGQNAQALECYGRALQLLKDLGEDRDFGRTLMSGLQALIYLGRYDQAFEWAEQARVIFERLGDELRLARLGSNIGNIFFRQDRHAEALRYYESAREPLARLGEPRDLAAVLSNMAVCSISLGQFKTALAYYQAARDHCVRYDLALLVAAADYNIAYLHYLRGDYPEAMRLYRLSRERAEQSCDFYHTALCDLDESEMCLELNLSDDGARLGRRAAERFEQLGMAYERAKAVVNQAMAASQRGNLQGALRFLRRAQRLFEGEQNRVWTAVIDLYQAFLRYREGNYSQARRLAGRASAILSGSPMRDKAVHCRLLEAQLLRQEGRVERSRAACLEILEQLDNDAAPSLRFHVYFVLGQIEEQLENWNAAWDAYLSARGEIENLRSRLHADELKISVLKDKLAVYQSLVWLSVWHRPRSEQAVRDAFLCIFQAKSRSLADHLAVPLGALSRQPPALQELIQDTRRDLNWYYREIERRMLEPGSSSVKQIEILRGQARQCEERLMYTLATSRATELGDTLPRDSEHIGLDAVRSSIPRDAVLLEYYESRGTLYVGILSHDQLRIWPLASSNRVRAAFRLFQLQISKFRLGMDYLKAFRKPMLRAALAHLEELYTELIAPIRPFLTARHLIIAPHGFLHGLPFHALCVNSHYLLDDYTISYAPSARVFCLCSARESEFQNESLVMGVPDPGAPHIDNEARYAAAVLPNARLCLGAEASESALRVYGPASRFVHIGSHGLFRRDNPMLSAIRLNDSYLSLFDLYQLPLSAELVTLSGCSTGLNEIVGGDELLGLIRGLLFAGAQAVLASLWDVHDRGTAEFMTAFYGLLPLENKAEALRKAMLEVRAQYPHPYYWAPFILMGKYHTGKIS